MVSMENNSRMLSRVDNPSIFAARVCKLCDNHEYLSSGNSLCNTSNELPSLLQCFLDSEMGNRERPVTPQFFKE